MRVFLGVSKNSMVPLSIMCWECIYSMRVHASLAIAFVRLWLSGLYVLWSCRCLDFGEIISCVHYANASTFIIWFDDNELVIFEVVQCCFFLYVSLL